MKKILIILFMLFMAYGCGEEPEHIDDAIFTVCDGGVRKIPDLSGFECRYIPITVNGKEVECIEEDNYKMQTLSVRKLRHDL